MLSGEGGATLGFPIPSGALAVAAQGPTLLPLGEKEWELTQKSLSFADADEWAQGPSSATTDGSRDL